MAIVGTAYVNIRAATKKLQGDVEKAFASLKDDLTIDIDANVEKAREKIEKLVRDRLVYVGVGADTGKASLEIDKLSKNKKVTVNADADTGAARAKMLGLQRPRKVPLSVEITQASLAKVGTTLAALSSGRVLGKTTLEFIQTEARLDELTPGIAKLSIMFGGLASVILSSSSGLLTLGASLLSIVNLGAIALPGMLAGFAVGFGSLIIALKDFNKVLPGVVSQYKSLGDVIQNNFWAVATDPIRELATTLFPLFRTGLTQTATALGGWAASLSGTLQEALTRNDALRGMFQNLALSINNAKDGTNATANSLVTLGTVGAALLPRLANAFSDIAVRFDSFLTEAAADGRLQGWVETGITALKELGLLIGNIISVFGNLTAAAKLAGSDGLTTLANAFGRLDAITSTPLFQGQLAIIFRGASDAASALGSGIGEIIKGLGSAAPAINSAFGSLGKIFNDLGNAIRAILSDPAFQRGFAAMFNGLQKGIELLSPVIATLGPNFGEIAEVVGLLAENLGGVLGEALTATLPLIVSIGEAVKPLIPVLGDLLKTAIKQLSPLFDTLGKTIVKLSPSIVKLIEAFTPLLEKILPPLVDLLIKALESGAIEKAINVITDLVDALTALTNLDFGKFITSLGKALGGIGELVSKSVINGLGGNGDEVFKTLQNLQDSLTRSMADFFKGAAKNTLDFLSDSAKNFKNFGDDVSKNWGDFWAGLDGFTKDTVKNIKKTFDDFIGFFKDTGDNIKKFFDDIGKFFGRFQKLLETIGSAFGDFSETVKSIFVGELGNLFGPQLQEIDRVISSGLQTIKTNWDSFWAGFAGFFQDTWNNIQNFFAPILSNIQNVIITTVSSIKANWDSFWGGIGQFFNDTWINMQNFFAPIILNIQNFINTVVGGIQATWNNFWGGIGSFFQTIWQNMLNFVVPIVLNIQSFIGNTVATIQSIWNNTWGAIGSFFQNIWQGISNFVVPIFISIQNFIGNVLGTIQNIWNNTWGAISGFFGSIWQNILNISVGFGGAVRDTVNNVFGTIGNIYNIVIGAIGNAGSWLFNAGMSIVQGIINGIGAMFGRLGQAIADLAGRITNGVKDFLGIRSPSRVMRDQVGKQIGQGLALGILDNIQLVSDATEKLALAAIPTIPPISVGVNPLSSTSYNSNGIINSNQSNNGLPPVNGSNINFINPTFNQTGEKDAQAIARELWKKTAEAGTTGIVTL